MTGTVTIASLHSHGVCQLLVYCLGSVKAIGHVIIKQVA
jgi:hypothetical protein